MLRLLGYLAKGGPFEELALLATHPSSFLLGVRCSCLNLSMLADSTTFSVARSIQRMLNWPEDLIPRAHNQVMPSERSPRATQSLDTVLHELLDYFYDLRGIFIDIRREIKEVHLSIDDVVRAIDSIKD